MKKWYVEFKENGDEYSGTLTVTAKSCVQIGSNSFEADGVLIEIDEDINSLEEVVA